MSPLTFRQGLWLLLLAVLCASVNLTKPVHIDDAGHVDISLAALRNPWKVMSYEVNWENTLTRISTYGRPPLLFYMFALVMAVFGKSLLALHAFIAVLSAVCMVFFHRLAVRFVPDRAMLYTAILFLGPAFLPGQGLMTDVPMLLFWLIAFWSMVSATEARSHVRAAAGAIAIGLACLVKYTSLALIPVLCLVLVLRRQWACLWVVVLPAAILVGWSVLNYYDYGGVHLLQSPYLPLSGLKVAFWAVDWISGLGSVSVCTLMFLNTECRARMGHKAWGISLFGGGVIYALCRVGYRTDGLTSGLWGAFFANGVLTLWVFFTALTDQVRQDWRQRDYPSLERTGVLLLWLGGATVFVVLFAPMMAIRHILLALPPIVLVIGRRFGQTVGRRAEYAGLGLTALLGFLLAVSDYVYAGVYREYAHRIAADMPRGARVWYGGHWGWQWYAEREGMMQYDTLRTVFADGDYLVVPSLVSQQEMPPAHKALLRKVRDITVESSAATWFRTMCLKPWGGYYAYSLHRQGPPWTLSCAPLDVIQVYVISGAPRLGGAVR